MTLATPARPLLLATVLALTGGCRSSQAPPEPTPTAGPVAPAKKVVRGRVVEPNTPNRIGPTALSR